MLPPRLPDTLETAINSRFSAALADQPVELGEFGARLLARVSPPNWTLEWSLPGWLGEPLGLHERSVVELTLANVFGLAYIKLQDDLMDGEISEAERTTALLLADVLHRKWLLVYIGLFPGDSPFWVHFERYMAQWGAATWRSQRAPAKPFRDYEDADWRSLGHRGAPLKTCPAAVCLLTQHESVLVKLEEALDYLLTGAVLFDHVRDWSADLAAGRHNAFVAYTSGWPQTPDYREANRRTVMQEILVGRTGQAYFELLGCEISAAQAIAHCEGFGTFARYLKWLGGETRSFRKALITVARDQLRRVVKPLLVGDETLVSV